MKIFIKKIILNLNNILSQYNLRITIQNLKQDKNLKGLSKKEKQNVKKILNLTMVSNDNLIFLVSAINYIKKNKIEGDYVETGVWKGGLSILSYWTFKEKTSKNSP